MNILVKKNLLGIGFTVATKRQVLEYLTETVKNKSKKLFVVTPNPEIIIIAKGNKSYEKVLNSADLALPDGVGILLAAKTLGVSLKGKITGVDLVQDICREVANRPITVGFLGGGPKIAEKTAECLKKRFLGLKIAFFGAEIENFKDLEGTDILFVAFGSPKQEFWIADNLKKLPVRLAAGVGGSFDFISGKIPRAPVWIREIGLEWLFRLIIQPWRIKRQLSLLKFVFLVLKQKFA